MRSVRVGVAGLAVLAVAGAMSCSDGATVPEDTAPAAVAITGSASVDIAGTVELTATITNAAGEPLGGTVTWASSDPAVLTVDAAGVVTGVARGAATVSASMQGASGVVQATHDVLVTVAGVTVVPGQDTLTSIGDTASVVAGAVDALGRPIEGVTIALTSTNPSAVAVLDDTLLVAVGSGMAEVMGEVDGKTGGAAIVVRQLAVSLSMPGTVDTLPSLRDTRTYTATAADARGNAIRDGFTWTSSDPDVATISGGADEAAATATGNGTTTIRVRRDGMQAEATLVVAQRVAGLVITPASVTLVETFTQQLSGIPQDARGNAVSGATVTWATSDAAVATVDGTGLVTGQGGGAATVTARAQGFEATATVTVTAVSFAQHVQPIFSNNCAFSGCHAGTSPAQGMNLSLGSAYDNIVNVQSNESALLRIMPFEPDSSYLIHKVEGTQASVGGSGMQMPRGGPPLSQELLDILRAWVRKGASNN